MISLGPRPRRPTSRCINHQNRNINKQSSAAYLVLELGQGERVSLANVTRLDGVPSLQEAHYLEDAGPALDNGLRSLRVGSLDVGQYLNLIFQLDLHDTIVETTTPHRNNRGPNKGWVMMMMMMMIIIITVSYTHLTLPTILLV